MDSQEFILKSGIKVYANNFILGITEENGELIVSGGYDQMIQKKSYCEPRSGGLTQEEKKEIAEYVISLWKKWANV